MLNISCFKDIINFDIYTSNKQYMSYNRNKNFKKKQNKKNPANYVTKEGSLGLLALGDLGLDMWRAVRNDNVKKTINE